MTEYRIGKAVVRMHGTPNREIIGPAAAQFLRNAEQQKRRAEQERRDDRDRNETCVRGVRQSDQR